MIEEGTEVRRFPQPVLKALKGFTEEAVNELVGSDPIAKKVYASYNAYRKKMNKWSEITEKVYYNELLEI